MSSHCNLGWNLTSVAYTVTSTVTAGTLTIPEVDGVTLNIAYTHHGSTKILADLHDNLSILVMSHSLYNSTSSCLGLLGFEDSTANKDTVHTKLHHECGISGCGDTTSGKVHNRQFTRGGNLLHELIRCLQLLRGNKQFILAHHGELLDLAHDSTCMTDGLYNVTSTGLTLGTQHSSTLSDTSQCFSQITASTYKWSGELRLINVVNVICHGKHLTLIDVINLACFKDLSLDEMSDTSLCHDWDGHCRFDFGDKAGVRHASYTSIAANIGRDTLQSHDCDGTGFLCDFRLFYVHHVHDNSSLEHLGKALLDGVCSDLGCVSVGSAHIFGDVSDDV
mmetsp:Transcript_34226/g.49690  ORF Transcript_34226/g.49690 Transcript_34226/m.49690 type:complete len:335 (-) Transcript_34226:121-1125(-)